MDSLRSTYDYEFLSLELPRYIDSPRDIDPQQTILIQQMIIIPFRRRELMNLWRNERRPTQTLGARLLWTSSTSSSSSNVSCLTFTAWLYDHHITSGIHLIYIFIIHKTLLPTLCQVCLSVCLPAGTASKPIAQLNKTTFRVVEVDGTTARVN